MLTVFYFVILGVQHCLKTYLAVLYDIFIYYTKVRRGIKLYKRGNKHILITF